MSDNPPPLSKADRIAIGGAVAPIVRRQAEAPRVVTVLGKDGKPVRKTTSAEVAKAVLARSDIEFSVQPGKRPEWVKCKICSAPVRVAKRGFAREVCPRRYTQCADCGKALSPRSGNCQSGEYCLRCQSLRSIAKAQAVAATFPEDWRREIAKKAAKNRPAKLPAPKKACVDCGSPISRRCRLGRCPTCNRRHQIKLMRPKTAHERSELSRRSAQTRRARMVVPSREAIAAALTAAGGASHKAAAAMGMSRRTFDRYVLNYGIRAPRRRQRPIAQRAA